MGASLLLLQSPLPLPLAAQTRKTVETLTGKVSNINRYFNSGTLAMHLPNFLTQLWPPSLARSHRKWRTTLNMANIAQKCMHQRILGSSVINIDQMLDSTQRSRPNPTEQPPTNQCSPHVARLVTAAACERTSTMQSAKLVGSIKHGAKP